MGDAAHGERRGRQIGVERRRDHGSIYTAGLAVGATMQGVIKQITGGALSPPVKTFQVDDCCAPKELVDAWTIFVQRGAFVEQLLNLLGKVIGDGSNILLHSLHVHGIDEACPIAVVNDSQPGDEVEIFL